MFGRGAVVYFTVFTNAREQNIAQMEYTEALFNFLLKKFFVLISIEIKS